MSKKAFIFDLDGVIVDSENSWARNEDGFLNNVLGEKIVSSIGNTTGISIRQIYDMAKELGFEMSREEFQKLYDGIAKKVYKDAEITPFIEELGEYLITNNYELGITSSSPTSWIMDVLKRLTFSKHIKSVISLNERFDLAPKPHPDGYLETMRILGSTPQKTIILEDSNPGIKAAKASGAFVIGLKQNLICGYNQEGADIYAHTALDVINLLKARKTS